MRKFFKNINKFGFVAILLAGTTAFAFTTKKDATVKWRPNYNAMGQIISWTNVDNLVQGQDYDCDAGSQTCTAQFPTGTTPSASTPIPADHVNGDFN